MIPPVLLRLLPPILALCIALGLIYWVVQNFKEQGRAELRPVIERLQTELEAERLNRQLNEEALNEYQQELDGLRRRPVSTRPVRLCNPDGGVVQGTGAASGTDGATAPSGGDAGAAGAGPDIGPALRNLAYQCDAENAKLRALQGWVRGLQ
jgi:hypothetical protein